MRKIIPLIFSVFSSIALLGQANGGWGNCEFATVAAMNAFDPSTSNLTCKKAFVQATDEHYRWDGTAWVLESRDVENIYNTSDTLTADRKVTLDGNDLTFEGDNDVFIQSDGKVGINTTAPSQDLDVNGIANIENRLYVGPNANTSLKHTLSLGTNFDTVGTTYQLYSRATLTSPSPLSIDRTSYGTYSRLTDNRTENIAGGFDVDGISGFFQADNSGTKTFRNLTGVRGNAQTTSTAGADLGNLYGGYFQGYNASASGTVTNTYGSYSIARGKTGVAGNLATSFGARGDIRPYNSNMTTAYGLYGYAATNDGYTGDITTAYGVRGRVRVDSDDGGNITTGRAGYFSTDLRDGANLMTTADGLYVDANAAATVYGVRVFTDDPLATNNYGLYLNTHSATTNNYGIFGVQGDWILDEDGDGGSGGTGKGGDLILGEGQDLKLYHDGTNSNISNNTGDLYITDVGTDDVILSSNGGNVGIGNTNPAAKLDVDNGSVRFSDYGTPATYDDASPLKILGVQADGDVVQTTIASLAGTDDQTASEVPFTPTGTIAATNVQTAIEEVASESLENIYNTSDALTADRVIELDNNNLTFDGTGTGDVIIEADGDVGIGTLTPTQKLDIAGAHKVQVGTLAGSGGGKLRVDVAASESENQALKTMMLRTSGVNYGVNGTAAGNGADTNTGLYGWASGATNNYGLRVDSGYGIFDDKVGIGTTAPGAQLEVTFDRGPAFTVGEPDNGVNTFLSSIAAINENTTNWSRALTALTPNVADGGISGLLTFGQGDAAGQAGHIYFVDTGASGEEYIGFGVRSVVSNILSLTGAGNTGVGTTTPDAKLDVEGGNVRFSDYGEATYIDTASLVTPAEATYSLAVNTNGDIVETNTAKSSKIFYPPALVIDVSSAGPGSIDLHDRYEALYGAPAIVSSGAPLSIPTYGETELFYYVTDYDTNVFSNLQITAAGLLTYNVDAVPTNNCAVFNVVFVVK